jgi:hypothetical protein
MIFNMRAGIEISFLHTYRIGEMPFLDKYGGYSICIHDKLVNCGTNENCFTIL